MASTDMLTDAEPDSADPVEDARHQTDPESDDETTDSSETDPDSQAETINEDAPEPDIMGTDGDDILAAGDEDTHLAGGWGMEGGKGEKWHELCSGGAKQEGPAARASRPCDAS